MGEYYSWVNIRKKEYIDPGSFDLGQKLHESTLDGNPLLSALYALLDEEWKYDPLIFLGDEIDINDNNLNPTLHQLYLQKKAWGETGYADDYVTDQFRNISGYFKSSEQEVRPEIQAMINDNDFEFNYYKVNPDDPFSGLFERDGKHYRYTVNRTKKEYFDIEKVPMIRIAYADHSLKRVSPLPLLFSFGSHAEDEKYSGLWIGDSIEGSNVLPSKEYKDISNIYTWDH